jgi:cephalosporin-C deacetylase
VTATTLMCVSLMDIIVPPSTVFAAYNEIPCTPGDGKDIIVYPYSGHDVPQVHLEHQLAHLRKHLPA